MTNESVAAPAMRRWWLFVLLLGALLAPAAARAHGGGEPVITRAEVGPYLLYVWSDPATPRAGETVHITIGVTQPDASGAETPITDAAVSVRAVTGAGGSGETQQVAAAPGANAGGAYYAADMELPEGLWTLEIEVTPAQGAGATGGLASFPLSVGPATSTTWWLVWVGAALLAVGVALYGVAVARSFQKRAVVSQ